MNALPENLELPATHFRLLIEEPASEPVEWKSLSIHGPVQLEWLQGGGPSLSAPTEAGSGETLMEPVILPGGRRRLMLLAHHTEDVRVNGLPVTPVVALRERDILRLGPGPDTLHLAVFHEPICREAGPEDEAKTCPICYGPLAGRIWVCDDCGCGLHYAVEEAGLRCAQPGNGCPACGRPMKFSPGYSHLPEVSGR